MIAGLSGSILSHDALQSAGLTRPEDGIAIEVHRALSRWIQSLGHRAGPAWTARKVFDEVGVPLCTALRFHVVPIPSSGPSTDALLQSGSHVVAVLLASRWGAEPGAMWRDAVRRGIGAGVRWCFCTNGRVLRLFDASRTHSRRYVEFDIDRIAADPVTFAVTWRLLRADAFAPAAMTPLDGAAAMSEKHRAEIRDSLQSGVHDAIARLTNAFLTAAKRARRGSTLPARAAYDESLVVIYRILFLFFAEARGLVPDWHPVFRDSYTVESLQPLIEGRLTPRGLWNALQAISRLAHRGCHAGTLRVHPFNGRLFSPAHAPNAEALPLDDGSVREALQSLTIRRDRHQIRRIAYAELGVEQLGGVYERVLDFDVSTSRETGAAILVRGTRRKATGSFYTPRSVTEYLVRRTLAPLVDSAAPDDILCLRILDPAMGSGAFLVAACRYLAQAYETALVRDGLVHETDVTNDDRAAFRRLVAQRCLYGVDLNPTAVQLARLSLWLATLCRDRPLTFFDRQLRTGNSLVGATIEDVVRWRSGGIRRNRSLPLFEQEALDHAIGSVVRAHVTLREAPEETAADVRSKERLFQTITSETSPVAHWKGIVDLWCAAWFSDQVRGMSRAFFQSLLDGRTLPDRVTKPFLETARDPAMRAGFFHWGLEFPEVFYEPSGVGLPDAGFDAVLGNPPWEMLRRDDASVADQDGASRLTRFTRRSGVYRFQGHGHANLYQLFTERAVMLARRGGRVGLVLPSGLATDHGCAELRRHLLDHTAIDSLVSVENRDAIFPIHRGLRFLLMTSTAGSRTEEVRLRPGAKSASDFDTLPESGTDPATVVISRELLERFSGPQLAIPDVRNTCDVRLAAKLAFGHPAAGDENGWGLRFGRELNATDDRTHFVERDSGAMPIVEGKQIHPFACDASSSRAFITAASAERLLSARAYTRSRLAYRDVASSTNRLTLIAAVLPSGVVTTHTLFCLKTVLDESAQHFLCGMLNSFVANFLVRLRVSTHVTVAAIDRLPLPRPERSTEAFSEMVVLAQRLARNPADTDASARHQALAARIYGLTVHEFEHVLTTFPLIDPDARGNALDVFRSTVAGVV